MLFSRSQGELILIIDVQSSIVRGSLVHVREGVKPSVIFTHNYFVPSRKVRTSSYLIKMAIRGVEEITHACLAVIQNEHNAPEIPRHITAVHYVLSSPWVVSQAKTVTQSFKDETSVSRAYVSGLIWEERKKMTSGSADDVRIIEEKVFEVRLNGYSVVSWESKRTRELSVSFVVSLAGGRMIDRFTEACRAIVRSSHVQFHSSLFLQHVGIQHLIPDAMNYALVHVHGELTDVAIIRNRACTFFGSYPLGVNNIVRTIAEEMKTTDMAAESILDLVIRNDVDTGKAKKEILIIGNMKKGWLAGFTKLMKGATQESLPPRVIISARSHEDFFRNALLEVHPSYKIEMLTIDSVLEKVVYGTHVERLRLTGLYVISICSLSK